jgi:hypothetical protein
MRTFDLHRHPIASDAATQGESITEERSNADPR